MRSSVEFPCSLRHSVLLPIPSPSGSSHSVASLEKHHHRLNMNLHLNLDNRSQIQLNYPKCLHIHQHHLQWSKNHVRRGPAICIYSRQSYRSVTEIPFRFMDGHCRGVVPPICHRNHHHHCLSISGIIWISVSTLSDGPMLSIRLNNHRCLCPGNLFDLGMFTKD